MHETSAIFEILAILKTTRPHLVGIDGIDGSGKTTLALSLSNELGGSHINLDDYIEQNLGQYVQQVNFNVVQGKLDEAKKPIIIEGVCLLAILEKLQRSLDMLIYIKRVSDYGSWRDEKNCDLNGDIDELINQKKEDFRKFVKMADQFEGRDTPNHVDFPELVEEIIRYHHEHRPHDKADIIYKRFT